MSGIEIHGREFEKLRGYARASPLVEVSTLDRDGDLVTWAARIDTGACLSSFPENLTAILPPLRPGNQMRVRDGSGIVRRWSWRIPLVLKGERGTWLECSNSHGYLADSREIGLIGLDILQDQILVMERGRFWLLSPDEWEVQIKRCG